jgi:hypothetical protein
LSNGWTSGQLDAFERDGYLIVEEGFTRSRRPHAPDLPRLEGRPRRTGWRLSSVREVKAGGASFHHTTRFTAPARTPRIRPVKTDPVYSRDRKAGDIRMDESYFPVAWSRSDGRSAWLDAELAQDLGSVLAEPGHRS